MIVATANGRLTRDPEIRYTKTNIKVASFTLASNRSKDTADFIDCTVFEERLVCIVEKYLKKGSSVVLSGDVNIESYEDKSGAKRESIKLIVKSFAFGEGGKKDE